MNRKELENTKPKREAFHSQEEFEEALGYWMGRVGRILALTDPSAVHDKNAEDEES